MERSDAGLELPGVDSAFASRDPAVAVDGLVVNIIVVRDAEHGYALSAILRTHLNTIHDSISQECNSKRNEDRIQDKKTKEGKKPTRGLRESNEAGRLTRSMPCRKNGCQAPCSGGEPGLFEVCENAGSCRTESCRNDVGERW